VSEWPLTQIVTLGRGQNATANASIFHVITGHIVDPGALGDTAQRIDVCAGTRVEAQIIDSSSALAPLISASDGLECSPDQRCSGVIGATDKYRVIAADGRDRDSIAFLPR
jgi:hypothetical protein